MSVNSLSPGFVRIFYGSAASPHTLTLGVNPVTATVAPGTEPQFHTRGGTQAYMGAAVTAFVNLLKPLFTNGVEFTHADFWSMPTPTSDPIYCYTTALAIVGTAAGGTVTDGMATITFRTFGGGIKRLVLLESIIPSTTAETAPFSTTNVPAVSNFIIGTSSWIYGRDNSYPFVALKLLGKVSDELRRRRLNL